MPSNKHTKTTHNSFITISSAILCSVMLYTLNAYGYLLLPENIRIEHASWRIVSTLHASLVVLFASLYLTKHISLSAWRTYLNLSTGYFVFDFAKNFFSQTIPTSGVIQDAIHHTIAFVVISSYIKKYPKLSAQGFLAEITTPILYISWFILETGHQSTPLFKVVGTCLLVSFLLFRVYNFTKILWSLYLKKATTFELFGFSGMVLINYYWFFLLIRKAFKTF